MLKAAEIEGSNSVVFCMLITNTRHFVIFLSYLLSFFFFEPRKLVAKTIIELTTCSVTFILIHLWTNLINISYIFVF